MEHIQEALVKYWGYDNFLPLQKQAMECVSRGRDSVVVLPTGGGKSLCYQAPAVTMEGLTIVVSPLISGGAYRQLSFGVRTAGCFCCGSQQEA